MPPERSPDDLVLELAETISDATPVDWESRSGELDDPRLANLRALESLAAAFRQSRGRQPEAARRGTPLFRWGHLEVAERLGEGTFGEVFRAYDPILDREVALKLRKDAPQGQTAAGRRQHLAEARRLARVRHPNVLLVHGADIHQGRVGLWTDLVEGVTLEERLAQRGPLPVDEASAVGRVLCEALAAVHAAGLLHGDVKTSNVLQEAAGRVVLADFGAGAELDGGAGALLSRGTPVTLAPEVLRGGKATAPADLYALGALTYRLLTGRYPIEGATLEEIALRVERGEGIPLRQRRPEVPAELAAVIDRALAARPEDRFASAEAMGEALAVAAGEGARPAWEPDAAPSAGGRWPVAAALFAIAAIAGVGAAWWLQAGRSDPAADAAGSRPLAGEHRLAFDLPGSVREAAFSPDGGAVAFVRHGGAQAGLWVRESGSDDARRLAAATLDPQRPRWTAAGSVVFSSRGGGLWRVPAEGGEPVPILDWGALPDVAPDGTLVFQGKRHLWLLAPGEGEPRRIEGVPRWFFEAVATSPAFSPDGSLVAFFLPESGPLGDLWVVPRTGGAPRRLTFDTRPAGDPAWTPDGRHLLFWSERQGSRTLWRVPVAGGDPEPVTSGAGEDSAPAVSADGATLFYTNTRHRWTLTALDLASCEPRDLLESRLGIWLPQLSPGGDRAAFFHPAGSGMHLFTIDLAGGPMEQQTGGDEVLNVHPAWWPDGRSLIYYEERPRPALRRLALGAEEPSELFADWTWQTHMHPRPHPDGQHLAYTGQDASAGSTLVRDLRSGAERALPEPHLHSLRWSPDGRWLAGWAHDRKVRVCDFDGTACRHVADGVRPEWSPDGEWLFFSRAGAAEGIWQLWRVAVAGGAEERLCDLGPQHPLSPGFAPTSADEVVLSRFFQGRDEIWQASLGR